MSLCCLIPFEHHPFAFEHKHFVFVIVAVPRRVSAGGDFELAHGKSGRAVGLPQQRADRATVGPFHIDRLGRHRFVMIDFHV